MNRKICLIVDNCSCHIILGEFSNIKIIYLPKNSTSILQPLDQGIIAALKHKYRQLLTEKILDFDKNSIEIIKGNEATGSYNYDNALKGINLLDAMNMILKG